MSTRAQSKSIQRSGAWPSIFSVMKRNLLSPNVRNFEEKLKAYKSLATANKHLRSISGIGNFSRLLHRTLMQRIRNGSASALRNMMVVNRNRGHVHRYQRALENQQRNQLANKFRAAVGQPLNYDPQSRVLRTSAGAFLFHPPPSPYQMYKLNGRLPRFGAFMQPFNFQPGPNGQLKLALLPRAPNHRVKRNKTNQFNNTI
jgi:hypothetical protein